MQIMRTEGNWQIGGGAGWVAAQLREGITDAAAALQHVKDDWAKKPVGGGLHPREAALAAAREAVAHLNEALTVEAPQDAIDETRLALEEIGAAIVRLERMGNKPPLAPIDLPTGHFEGAIGMLERIEHRLRDATVGFG